MDGIRLTASSTVNSGEQFEEDDEEADEEESENQKGGVMEGKADFISTASTTAVATSSESSSRVLNGRLSSENYGLFMVEGGIRYINWKAFLQWYCFLLISGACHQLAPPKKFGAR